MRFATRARASESENCRIVWSITVSRPLNVRSVNSSGGSVRLMHTQCRFSGSSLSMMASIDRKCGTSTPWCRSSMTISRRSFQLVEVRPEKAPRELRGLIRIFGPEHRKVARGTGRLHESAESVEEARDVLVAFVHAVPHVGGWVLLQVVERSTVVLPYPAGAAIQQMPLRSAWPMAATTRPRRTIRIARNSPARSGAARALSVPARAWRSQSAARHILQRKTTGPGHRWRRRASPGLSGILPSWPSFGM